MITRHDFAWQIWQAWDDMNENNLGKNDITNAVIKNEMTSRDRYDIPLRKIASRDVTKIKYYRCGVIQHDIAWHVRTDLTLHEEMT